HRGGNVGREEVLAADRRVQCIAVAGSGKLQRAVAGTQPPVEREVFEIGGRHHDFAVRQLQAGGGNLAGESGQGGRALHFRRRRGAAEREMGGDAAFDVGDFGGQEYDEGEDVVGGKNATRILMHGATSA